LIVQREGKHDVGAYFPCVEFAVEAAKLDSVVACEKAVEIAKIMFS